MSLLFLWMITSVFFTVSVHSFSQWSRMVSSTVKTYESQLFLIEWLQKCEEKLQCGFPLEESDFNQPIFTEDQYKTISSFIRSLRASGQPLLPSLKSIRESVLFVNELLKYAETKATPARLQSKVSLFLVGSISLLLYFILETPREHPWIWIFATVISIALGGLSFAWIEVLIQKIIYNGSQKNSELKWYFSFLFPELFLGGIQLGKALDVVWSESLKELQINGLKDFPKDLLHFWNREEINKIENFEYERLRELKMMIQNSMLHGTPVKERIILWKNQTQLQFKSELQQRLETLPHRCLMPLYCCVAPAVIGLLVTGLFLEIQENALF